MGAVRVLIVDDEDDMRSLLRNMIEIANDGLSVAGEAADGDQALRFWREAQPDVVVLDQRMPGLTGLETAARMLAEVKAAADRIGVRACVPKDDARMLVFRLRECAAA